MKGIIGFIIWVVVGYVSGIAFDFHGVIDILLWPIGVIFRIWQKINGEDWK